MSSLTDNKALALSRAIQRSEELLIQSYMLRDGEEACRRGEWAIAVADEWNFPHELRLSIAASAREWVRTHGRTPRQEQEWA